jgi:predicted transcriptional regulator
MKGKHFYSHLIEIHEIYLSISEIDLEDSERSHLLSLAEANIHATVINTVLPQLSEEDKKIFLKNLVANDHEKTWKHLSNRIKNIESKLSKSLQELRRELLKDIEEAKES